MTAGLISPLSPPRLRPGLDMIVYYLSQVAVLWMEASSSEQKLVNQFGGN